MLRWHPALTASAAAAASLQSPSVLSVQGNQRTPLSAPEAPATLFSKIAQLTSIVQSNSGKLFPAFPYLADTSVLDQKGLFSYQNPRLIFQPDLEVDTFLPNLSSLPLGDTHFCLCKNFALKNLFSGKLRNCEGSLCAGDPLHCYDHYLKDSLTLSGVSPTTQCFPISWGKVTKNNQGAGNLVGTSRIRQDKRYGQQRWERDGRQTFKWGGYRLPLSQKSDMPVKALLPRPPLLQANYVEIQIYRLPSTVLLALQIHLSSSAFLSCATTKIILQCWAFPSVWKVSSCFQKDLLFFLPWIRFYNLSFLIYNNIVVS